MTGHGPSSVIVSALERTWAEVRDRHPEVPEVVFITGTGRSKMQMKWGHWCPDRWATSPALNADRLPEVFISGEALAQGARQVLQTLLHEAAHGLCHVRGIQDTSRGNRYHNQKFVKAAEELGLKGPETADAVRGWSAVTLPEETERSYASFPLLADAIVVCIGGKLETSAPTKAPAPKKPQPKYGCGCEDRFIRLSAKVYEAGAIICGLCDEPFLEVM